jgi:hypothetical protein
VLPTFTSKEGAVVLSASSTARQINFAISLAVWACRKVLHFHGKVLKYDDINFERISEQAVGHREEHESHVDELGEDTSVILMGIFRVFFIEKRSMVNYLCVLTFREYLDDGRPASLVTRHHHRRQHLLDEGLEVEAGASLAGQWALPPNFAVVRRKC